MLRPLLDVITVHPVVLLAACLYLGQLLLVYALCALAVIIGGSIFLDWVELRFDQEPCVRILGRTLLDDDRFGETLRLRVVVDQIVYALVITEAF